MGRIVIDATQYEPKPLVGYADTVSVRPGGAITFHVSCDGAALFRADIVRLIHGDLAAGGPGLREEVITSPFSATYAGSRQETYPGSYMVIDDPAGTLGRDTGLTMLAMVCPTKPRSGHPQAVISKWSKDDDVGWALYLDEGGRLCFRRGAGDTTRIGLQTPMLTRVWYLVAASVDVERKRLTLQRIPVINAFNGRLALRHPSDELGEVVSVDMHDKLEDHPEAALMLGAWQETKLDSGRLVGGAHFNGKIDSPRIVGRALAPEQLWQAVTEPLTVPGLVAAWDFAKNITSAGIRGHSHVEDLSSNRRHGRLVNTPTRGVTGYNWDGSEYSYRHAPHQYGAIHFHDDDLTDCAWEATCTFAVPADLESGVYAARIRAEIEGVPEEDHIPFFVRPAGGRARKRVLYVAPTASYLAYANDEMAADSPFIEVLAGAVPHMDENVLARHQHREYGASLYDVHSDGSGVCYSSWLRPLLTVRPKYRHSATRVWQFNADLHLINWFERMGYPVDVITDHDLHHEGFQALKGYRVVTTGTHPEYYSGGMLDALQAFIEEDGGRLMYLGGNGFYWVTGFSPEDPRLVEVRRWGGTEAWTAQPGEHCLSFTGEMGGLWRNRGRAPQKLVGVGFVAQGLDRGTYFARRGDSFLPETEWIFDGIGAEEPIGDFNVDGGGAAGLEIDWFDPTLGSPGWAHLLASSEGHSRLMLEARENVGLIYPYMGGDMDPRVRADMVYFKTASDGAVFSTGSISWCGSLSHNDYDNNVSRIMKNVLDRFASDERLP